MAIAFTLGFFLRLIDFLQFPLFPDGSSKAPDLALLLLRMNLKPRATKGGSYDPD
jgi:hypothetical protein